PNGTIELPAVYLVPSGTPTGIASADFDGDGRNDIVVSNAGIASLSIFLNAGNGTLKAPVALASSFLTAGVTTGDVNGDGKVDIVAISTGNNALVYLGNGDGTFKPALTLTVGTTPRDVLLADMNGDTFLDVITGNLNSANVSIVGGK